MRASASTLTLLTVIASETEWAVARGGALARISRRRISQVPVLARPALAAVLAAVRTDAVHMNLQNIRKSREGITAHLYAVFHLALIAPVGWRAFAGVAEAGALVEAADAVVPADLAPARRPVAVVDLPACDVRIILNGTLGWY